MLTINLTGELSFKIFNFHVLRYLLECTMPLRIVLLVTRPIEKHSINTLHSLVQMFNTVTKMLKAEINQIICMENLVNSNNIVIQR